MQGPEDGIHGWLPSPAAAPSLFGNPLPSYLFTHCSYGMTSHPAGTWGGEEVPFLFLLQVAIKLSGWRWRGRQVLRLHPRAEVGTVADTVLALLEKLEEEESVLVEAVCPPARLSFPGEGHLGRPGMGVWLGLLACLCWAQASPSSPRQSPTWPCTGCADLCRGVSDTG